MDDQKPEPQEEVPAQEEQATEQEQAAGHEGLEQGLVIDYKMRQAFTEAKRKDSNLTYGFVAGIVAMLVSACIWAAVTVSTGYQIGYLALGVGVLVGFSVRFAGKGVDPQFGIMAAIMAFLACVIGNAMSMIGFFAYDLDITFFEAFDMIDLALIPEAMIANFDLMDILFYGLATYEGFKFGFDEISDDEILDGIAEARARAAN